MANKDDYLKEYLNPFPDRLFVFVVAGNWQQAKIWASKESIPNNGWSFVHNPLTLKSVRFASIAFVGTWNLREDIDEIQREVDFLLLNERVVWYKPVE